MLKYILTALAILFTTTPAPAQQFTPTQYILYKNGAAPIPAQAPNQWLPPGYAYTSITIPAPLLKWKTAGLQVVSASSQIVWKPKSPGGYTSVAIFLCPPQPHAGTGMVGCSYLTWFAANDSELASYTPGCTWNNGSVMPCRADITAALQSAIDNATSDQWYFALVTYGNGTNGPDVYDAEFFVDWAR